MPSKSKAQHNLMQAVAHNKAFAKKVGIPQTVGRDFAAADKGRKFMGGGMASTDFANLTTPQGSIRKYAGGGEIKASPRSSGLGALSDALKELRRVGNKAELPVIGGIGDLLLGRAPEEVEEWAYGNAPMHVPEMSMIPQIKHGRAVQVMDVAGSMPLVIGGGKAAASLAKDIAKDALLPIGGHSQRVAYVAVSPDMAKILRDKLNGEENEYADGGMAQSGSPFDADAYLAQLLGLNTNG